MTRTLRRRLAALRHECARAAGARWSCAPRSYRRARGRRGPLYAHCVPVSLLVQAVAGGSIVRGVVRGESHCWNRLPGGVEVDLTSCQFGGDGWRPVAKALYVYRPDQVDAKFLQFAVRVAAECRRRRSCRRLHR